MAYQSIWYYTELPDKMVDIIEEDLKKYDTNLEQSVVGHGSQTSGVNLQARNSKNSWIPTTHWVSGFIWHYVQKANRENFLYDITNIDAESLQYTNYSEGEYYNWHIDAGISTMCKPMDNSFAAGPPNEASVSDFLNSNAEKVRKLSFSLLLSDPLSYEGGNLQLLDEHGKSYIAPRQRGVIILFDSRTQHRVLKVTKGVRKSIVGWTVGPRWR